MARTKDAARRFKAILDAEIEAERGRPGGIEAETRLEQPVYEIALAR